MTRPVSSNILYPFIPGTSRDDYIAGIKEIVLVPYAPYTATVVVAGRTEAFAALQEVNASGALPVDYVFGAFTPTGNTNEFYYREITFTITASTGLGSVQSTDGYSHLFVAFEEIVIPGAPQSLGYDNYILEPGCVRWLQSSAIELVIVNEERLSDPADRTNLDNTVLRTFDSGDPIRINEGYNVSLEQDGNDLKISAYPGAGKGVAPDNMWDDTPPPVAPTSIKTINGQSPETDGDFLLDKSASIGFGLGTASIDIIHNHPV
jgi:hypothetical protein